MVIQRQHIPLFYTSHEKHHILRMDDSRMRKDKDDEKALTNTAAYAAAPLSGLVILYSSVFFGAAQNELRAP